MRKLSIVVLMVLSISLFANNNVVVGTVDDANGNLSVISNELGETMFVRDRLIFKLSGSSLSRFLELTSIHLELMEKVESDSLDIKYRRSAGTLITTDFRKIFFIWYSDGTGYEGCKVIMSVVTDSEHKPHPDVFTFTGDDIKGIREMLSKSDAAYKDLQSKIRVMNEIISKTVEQY